MFKKILLLLAVMFAGSSAQALTCNSYPYTLVNGVVADANQVMANFNLVRDCVDTNVMPIAGGAFTGAISVSGNITLSGSSQLILNGAAGTNRLSVADTAGVIRWAWGANSGAETGTNAGSDWILAGFADGGGGLGSYLQFSRATGIGTFQASPIFPTPSTSDNSTKGATTAYVRNAIQTGTVSLTAGVGATINFSPAFATTVDSIVFVPTGAFGIVRAFSYAAGSVSVVANTTDNYQWIAVGH